ncbi:helix-turn-helix domain-containing protein [Agrobacterium tumefaciens]|uniref:helix-turn-helix domain-containing protein n=1 Tax=Agrobacterium tumefaciens TaxID=358 RepID=UPI0021D00783|nr:helix-turn-helix transcriptional regulator [Agrobacterium tumefaciens]UXS03205.1 helix-turn-helix transcriptional regulator [Agrobacterium tumefaciens]
MARAALRWGVRDLATHAKVTPATITRLESGKTGHAATLIAIQVAFENAGLQFIEENGGGAGVRFSKPRTETQR